MAPRPSGKKGMFYGRRIKSSGGPKGKQRRKRTWMETPAMRCEAHHTGRCRDCTKRRDA